MLSNTTGWRGGDNDHFQPQYISACDALLFTCESCIFTVLLQLSTKLVVLTFVGREHATNQD